VATSDDVVPASTANRGKEFHVQIPEQGLRQTRARDNQLRDGTIVISPPKSQAGLRKIAIPPHLMGDVESHLDRYVEPDPDALLFTGIKGGPLRLHVLQRAWDRARTSVGRQDLHLHDLRHSGNTWAAATGASTRDLMARMGHSSPRTALIYQHATADRDKAIADALSRLATQADVVPLRGCTTKSESEP